MLPRDIEAAFHSFAGLPHRSQTVAEINGVRWVNDSKATNVDSAEKALTAFDNIRWIAGGLGKEGGIAALTPQFGRVTKAYLIGHSARDFALQLSDTPHEVVETMEAAVARAHAEAEPGDAPREDDGQSESASGTREDSGQQQSDDDGDERERDGDDDRQESPVRHGRDATPAVARRPPSPSPGGRGDRSSRISCVS